MFKSLISGRILKCPKDPKCRIIVSQCFYFVNQLGIYVERHWRRSVQYYIIGELLSKREYEMHLTKNISVCIHFRQVCKAFIILGSSHIRFNLFQFLCNNGNLYARFGNVLMYYTHKIGISSRSVKCPHS